MMLWLRCSRRASSLRVNPLRIVDPSPHVGIDLFLLYSTPCLVFSCTSHFGSHWILYFVVGYILTLLLTPATPCLTSDSLTCVVYARLPYHLSHTHHKSCSMLHPILVFDSTVVKNLNVGVEDLNAGSDLVADP